jgi:hypothetical protein
MFLIIGLISSSLVTGLYDVKDFSLTSLQQDHFYFLKSKNGNELLENHPPDKPSDPLPEDGSINNYIILTLSVLVIDRDNDSMDVYFYDASDDSFIGNNSNTPNGSRAKVQWEFLEYNTTYFWYAVVNDSISENYSYVWQFTTEKRPSDPPEISIIKPKRNRIYYRNFRLTRRIIPTSFIIGHITIKAEAIDDEGIKRVEFYIDDNKRNFTSEIDKNGFYSWTLNDRTLFFNHRHKITVYAIDKDNNIDSDSINVYIINFPLLHPFRG